MVLIRGAVVLAALAGALLWSGSAEALTPKVAICGRVTSVTPAQPPESTIVRLGTQEPRRLVIGSGVIPQLGEEICVWGIDVLNVNPPAPDPAPKGIAAFRIAPLSAIDCGSVVGGIARFVMPGETSAVPEVATLVLPLSKPADDGCVRIAVDAQGNPVAVVIPRAASTPTPTPRPSLASLPGTASGFDKVTLVVTISVIVIALLAAALLLRRRRGDLS